MGIIIGVVVLLAGIGVGGFLLLGGDDDDKKDGGGKNIERLAKACPLLTAEELSQKTGVSGLTSREIDRRRDKNRIRLQCSYYTPDQRLFSAFVLSIFNEGLCNPQACVDQVKKPTDQPVSGVGDAAVFTVGANNRGQLFAVKAIGSRSIAVDVTGPGPTITANDLSPYVEQLFKKLEDGDYEEGEELKGTPSASDQPVA